MEPATLQLIHKELIDLKKEVMSLKECFHEDFLELSDNTKEDIELSRKQIKEGKFTSLDNL